MMSVSETVLIRLISKPAVLILTFLLFFISLTLPAFYTEYRLPSGEVLGEESYIGWLVLLSGWVAIFSGAVGWFANLGLLVTLVLYGVNHGKVFYWALGSLLVALSSGLYTMGYDAWGGTVEYISCFGAGFYCWISAYGVLCIGAGVNQYRWRGKAGMSSQEEPLPAV